MTCQLDGNPTWIDEDKKWCDVHERNDEYHYKDESHPMLNNVNAKMLGSTLACRASEQSS
jgi:hypothetical protein